MSTEWHIEETEESVHSLGIVILTQLWNGVFTLQDIRCCVSVKKMKKMSILNNVSFHIDLNFI